MKFRKGTEDKYMYFVAQWGYILFYVLIAIFGLTVLVSEDSFWLRLGTGIFSIFGLTRAMWHHRRLSLWYWRMNNFEEYKASVLAKWPDMNQPVWRISEA